LDEETRKVDPNRTIAARFENEIIAPIRQLDAEQVSAAVRNLDNCRRSLSDPAALTTAVNETAAVQEAILERMRTILAAMEDSENYQEVVNKLLEIKRAEERMQQQLKQKETPDGIFDEPGKDKAAPSPTPNKGVFDDDQTNVP
jgi:protein subunit release factor A